MPAAVSMPAQPPQPQPLAALAPRWLAAGCLLLGVLALHALLLGWTAPPAGQAGPRKATGAALQTRQIALSQQPPATALSPATRPATPATTPATPAPARPQPAVRASAATPAPAPASDSAAPAETPDAAAEPPPVRQDSDPGLSSVPVYATRLPPSTQLRYALRRGGQRGEATLRWQTEGDSFELSLHNDWRGAQALGSVSRGHMADSGLAPERHTESRRGRELRAINFQYDSARITFSGPGVEYPLVAGAQDRLSWLVQLAGILEADPALRAPGREIRMFVAGSRGDGQVWRFVVQGDEALDLPAGHVEHALHLRREAGRVYDTQAEVWLDPARGHLPVRVRLLVRPTGEATEFELQAATSP